MALLRLPPISLQYLGHKSEQKTPNPGVSLTNFSLTWSTPSLSRLHLAKPRNLTSYSFATTQEPSSSEEISKTRLIAQNVPWTSTPEDIRSLFEKSGSVVDVEVSLSQFLLLFQTLKSLLLLFFFLFGLCRCLCTRRKGIEVWFSLKWLLLKKLHQLFKLSNPM